MHRIDGATADENNRFRYGDPALGIPATKVSAEWLNDVQENLAKFIEAQGVVLAKGNWDQLTAAIAASHSTFHDTTTKKTINNNQVAYTNLAGLVFDKTKIKGVLIKYDLQRKTDDIDLLEVGSFRLSVKSGVWVLIPGIPQNDDCGVDWSVDAATGQLQYKSTALAGLNYAGNIYLRIEQFIL